jgi:hypothetical protein
MNHQLILKCVILMSLMTALRMSAQQLIQTPGPQVVQMQEPASLEGIVLRESSAPPAGVPRARVVLSSAERGISAPTVVTAVTDDNGRFALRGILPGSYNLIASRDGYVRTSKPVVLASNDSLINVVLEITPTGAISGHIRNRAGDPLSNAVVQAQRYTYREGRRDLTNVQSTRTNDLGEYRLFYLPPSRYVINATPESGPRLQQGPANTTTLISNVVPGIPTIGAAPTTGNPEMTELQYVRASALEFLSAGLLPSALTGAAYVPVYFPGTMDASAATAIDLSPGENFTNADFTVSEMRSIRIRGRIIDGVTGQSAVRASVTLLSKDSGGGLLPSRSTGSVAADGTFEFLGVAPGKYDVIALVGTLLSSLSSGGTGYPGGAGINPGPPPPAGAAPRRDFSVDPTGVRLAARVPIEVSGANMDDVVLTAQVGYTLRGRVTIEGASLDDSQRQLDGVVIQLMPTSGDFESAAMPGIVRPDGSFTIVGALPGTYQIWIMGAANMQPGLTYVKSATLGGIDAINPRLFIDREPRGELEIVVSTARGSAMVSVVDAKQAPAKGATVVFVPETSRRQHFDLYQRGTTDPTNGSVAMNMPVGDYTAYAFQNIEINSWADPEVMQKYAGQGTAVRIEPGERQQLTLKLIPSR